MSLEKKDKSIISSKKYKTIILYHKIWKIWGKKNIRLLIKANLLMVLVAASTAAYPLVIDFSFDVLSNKNKNKLMLVPIIIIIITIIKGLSYYYQTVIVAKISNSIIKDIQITLYQKIINMDLYLFSHEKSGTLQSRFINDVNILKESIIRGLNNMVRDFFTLIGLIISMFYLDWFLSIVVLIIYPICFVPVIKIGQKSRALANSLQEKIGNIAAFLNESFLGIRLIKTFNLEKPQIDRATNYFSKVYDVNLSMVRIRARLEPILEIVGGLAIASVLVIAGMRIISDNSDLASFTGFISALLIAVQPARALGTLNSVLQEGGAAAQRIIDIYMSKPKITEKKDPIILNNVKGDLELVNVNFSYNKLKILKNINISIRAGEKVAIVGASGSGKSTFVNLIPRLFDPTSGIIKIDGIDIKTLSIKSLRENIAMVAQDVMLFNTSVTQNIAYGSKKFKISEIKAAAKKADAHKFIMQLSKGYNTNVGERGFNLSGGERQKISIARAILKNPKIIILDEPTSSLDAKSEDNINKALSKLVIDRTTFIIAHKVSTIVNADRIILIKNGTIMAEGNHTELMEKNVEYKNTVLLQNIN